MESKKLKYFTVMLLSISLVGMLFIIFPRGNYETSLLISTPITIASKDSNQSKQGQAKNANRQRISEIEILLKEHFSINYSDPKTYLASLKDIENYDRLIKIKSELSTRIDNGSDVSPFEIYGLIRDGNRSFRIDNRESPGWLTLNEIFAELRSTEHFRRELAPRLRSIGFDQQEIERLNIFLNNYNPQADIYRAILLVLDDVLTRGRALPDNEDNYIAYRELSIEMSDRMNASYEEIMKHWSLNLINSFDLYDQEILFEFLLSRQTTTHLFPTPEKDVITRFIHDVDTDEARITIRRELENL